MRKKHFVTLAAVLRALRPAHYDEPPCFWADQIKRNTSNDGELAQWQRTVDALANWCALQSSTFLRERWLGYIHGTNGPNGGKQT